MIRRLVRSLRSLASRPLFALLALATVVYALTSIPHVLAYVRTPPGMIYGGALIWSVDQDSYFSFIRQAAEGHFLFVNRLTSLQHAPVFINLEWFFVGRVMAWLNGSTDAAYVVWRAAAALALVGGFSALAQVALRDKLQRRIALFMCLFGGAFQTVFFGLNVLIKGVASLFGREAAGLSTDFPYFATHPFAQVLANPHFALPLGVFMFAMAAYIRGERTKMWRWYAIAGAVAAIEGWMRPYEMIALYTFVPLFVAIETFIARRIEWRVVGMRTLPLLIAAPVLGFSIYIFNFHPIFKYWASQGIDVPIAVSNTIAHMGLAGVLVAVRLCRVRTLPLNSPVERLLLAWMVAVFLFIHANAIPMLGFMPYTPQLMTGLMPPVILLGVGVFDRTQWKWAVHRPRWWMILVFGFVSVDALDSVALLRSLTPLGNPREEKVYIRSTEMDAYQWLDREAAPDDVVMCRYPTGHRLAKYAPVRVVSAHWSITPKSEQTENEVQRFYRNLMSPEEAASFLAQHRVKWIYSGPNERKWGPPDLGEIPGFTKHVLNQDVTLYSSAK